jgi:hypothetical protein
MLQGNVVKIFNSTQTFKNVFVLKFELILIIGSNKVLTEGDRKVYRGRQGARGRSVGQGWTRGFTRVLVMKESLFHAITDSGAQSAYYPIGTGDSFPGGKAAGAQNYQLTSN